MAITEDVNKDVNKLERLTNKVRERIETLKNNLNTLKAKFKRDINEKNAFYDKLIKDAKANGNPGEIEVLERNRDKALKILDKVNGEKVEYLKRAITKHSLSHAGLLKRAKLLSDPSMLDKAEGYGKKYGRRTIKFVKNLPYKKTMIGGTALAGTALAAATLARYKQLEKEREEDLKKKKKEKL